MDQKIKISNWIPLKNQVNIYFYACILILHVYLNKNLNKILLILKYTIITILEILMNNGLSCSSKNDSNV